MLLDTSIFASMCSVYKLREQFDPLLFAERDTHIAKLADMHGAIRRDKLDNHHSSFIYHPDCYQLSILLSQSWGYYIYFIGIDCLVLQIFPLIAKIVNMVLIIKKVNASNEFRIKSNARLIPLFTLKFVANVAEVAFLTILFLLFIGGICPVIWNDPSGMFLDNTLDNMKHIYITYLLLYSFIKYAVLTPLREISSSKVSTINATQGSTNNTTPTASY